jgi:hypothetical protein
MDSAPTQADAEEIFASAPPSAGAMREMESRPVGQGGLGPKQPSIGELREMESRPMGQGGLGPKASMADIEQEYEQRLKPKSEEERQVQATKGFVRYAPAIAAPMLFPPAAGATLPGLVGLGGGYAAISAAGETAGQMMEGEMDPSKVWAAAIRGAVPMPAGKIVAPMATQAAANLTARYLEEGGITPGGAALDIGIPTTIATIGRAGKAVGGMADALGKASKKASDIERMGAQATVGQAFESMAAFEQRTAAKIGGEALRDRIQRQQDRVIAEINKLRGGSGLEDKTQDIVLSTARFLGLEDAQNLAGKVSAIDDIDTALLRTADEAQKQFLMRAKLQAESELGTFVQNSLMKGPTIKPYQAVSAGTRMENLAEDLKRGLSNKAEQIYAPAKGVVDNPVFSLQQSVPDPRGGGATTIETHARELLSEIPDIPAGGLSELKKLLGRKTTVPAPPSMNPTAPLTVSVMQPASHNELRGVIRELYDFADSSGEALKSVGQRKIQQLIETMKRSIDTEAPTVLGARAAQAISDGNAFYAQNRPLLDSYAVKRLFASDTMRTGQGAESAVRGISAQGLDAPEIKNLLTAHETLKKSGAVVPSLDTVFSDIRAGIVSPYVDKLTGNFQQGAFEDLAKLLSGIESQTPGTLTKLGFGSRKELNDFIGLLRASKDAGPEATEKLLRSGIPGWTLISASLDSMPNVRTANALKNHLQKEAASGNVMAQEAQQKVTSKALEDLLVMTTKGNRRLNLDQALNTLKDPKQRETLRSLVGARLLRILDTQFQPGLKVMSETEQLAGRAGMTVGGAAVEQSVQSAESFLSQLTTGKFGRAIQTAIDALYRNTKYKVLADWMAAGAGSTGLKSKAGTLKSMERILTAPGTASERAIQQSIKSAMEQQEPSPE